MTETDKTATSNTNTPDTSSKTILLVEDDKVLQSMYEQKLKNEGFRVLCAGDGEVAYDIFQKENIDLIISDIMLPRMSGNEFLAKVKKTDKGKNIPAIAWSNLALEEEKKQVLDLGAVEYIVKEEMSLEQLVDTVKKILNL